MTILFYAGLLLAMACIVLSVYIICGKDATIATTIMLFALFLLSYIMKDGYMPDVVLHYLKSIVVLIVGLFVLVGSYASLSRPSV